MFDNKNESKTPLSEIGEFGLIKQLTKNVKLVNKESKLGIGDDACIIDSFDKETIISTDLLAEGIHFNLQYVPLKHLGYKAVVINISDILAMGATPKQILVSIAVSNRFTVEALEEIYEGIYAACKKYNIDLVGGDTTSSNSGLVMSVTAIGYAEKKKAFKRSGAKENDLIAVTGNLGASYLGLQILERESLIWQKNPSIQPNLQEYPYIIERQLKPEVPTKVLNEIKKEKITINSMIDVSDGLSSELLHIAESSKVGIRIYEDKIPIDLEASRVADELKLNPTLCALHGGEDYELLFTFPLDEKEKIEKIKGITIIGHVTGKDSGSRLVSNNGEKETDLIAQGWDSFKKSE